MASIFSEISIILFIALVLAGITRFLKQPMIIGYILTGIIAGPTILGLIRSSESIQAFADIGIALLLFIVGLHLNPRTIKEVGVVSIVTGVGQVVFTSTIGFCIAKLLGFSTLSALYIALALSFSSTIIIMKLLSDKGELESLYGKVAIGFLIVQDLLAILIIMVVSATPIGINFASLAVGTALQALGLLIFIFAIALYAFPIITPSIARSQEYLLLFSISWCFIIAALFHYLHFSMQAGALFAGIMLSLSPYRHEIGSKLRPLRDFFIIIFFILLGSQLIFSQLRTLLVPIVLLSLLVLLGNPLIIMILMGALGFTKRNSFMAGLTVAQVSEFSLILVAMGISLGHLENHLLSLLTIITLITITCSSYFILYADKMYPYVSKYLAIFERKRPKDKIKNHKQYQIILFGYNRIGFDILETFKRIKQKFLVVDYNPQTIATISKQGTECRYGDADDPELLQDLQLQSLKMAISTIPSLETNILLIHEIRKVNKQAIIALVAHQIDDALELYEAGATYVLLPHFVGGKHISAMIEDFGLDEKKYLKERLEHLQHLRLRKEMGHEHPRRE